MHFLAFLRLVLCVCLSLGLCAVFAFKTVAQAEFAVMWQYRDMLEIIDSYCPLAFGVSFGVLVAILCQSLWKPPISVVLALFSGPVVALALSIFGIQYYRAQCVELNQWTRSVARLTSVAAMNRSDNGRGGAIWKFEYTYRVGNVDYVGTYCNNYDVRRYQTPRRNKAKNKKLTDVVRVFYDPADPQRSRLTRWVRVPPSVLSAATLSVIYFMVLLGCLYWRGIERVNYLQGADSIGESRFSRPYVLPLLVALGSYLLGAGAFGAFFWNSGDPVLGPGVAWFGRYSACHFGVLCATVGSALWPKDIIPFRLGVAIRTSGNPKTDRDSWIWLKMGLVCIGLMCGMPPLMTGFAFAIVNASVLLGVGASDQPELHLLLFAALGLAAAAVTIGLMLVWCRFSRSMRLEIAVRGMTVKRYFGRLGMHLWVVATLGFVGYELLTWTFCATVLWPFLKQELATWFGLAL